LNETPISSGAEQAEDKSVIKFPRGTFFHSGEVEGVKELLRR